MRSTTPGRLRVRRRYAASYPDAVARRGDVALGLCDRREKALHSFGQGARFSSFSHCDKVLGTDLAQLLDDHVAQLRSCMYQYSRAIYRSIKDLIDPYASRADQLEYRRAVLEECERTMSRLADDPHYFARPDRALFADIRRYFPITAQAQVAWSVARAWARRRVSSSSRSRRACSTVVSPAATRRRGRERRANARPSPAATTARRTSISSTPPRSLPTANRAPRGGGKLAGMSHDADKLIRQLSLVAFLMAERRLLTARDVKSNVEGYSEMSDEAFARRFYSDRAELTALGVPLQSQRDEFTGEELYTLRSEHYFLDRLDLDDDELAALQTALYYLEGKFAYAEPLRLALQNLALGRVGSRGADGDRRARPGERTRLLAGAGGQAREARVRDLEAAHGALRLLEPSPHPPGRANDQPLCAAPRRRQLVRRRARPRPLDDPDLQGLADPRRHPLCHAA